MNQQGPQVAIAPLTDPKQHGAAAAGVMAWNQAQVGRELAATLEFSGIA